MTFFTDFYLKNTVILLIGVGGVFSSSFERRGRKLRKADRAVSVPIYVKDEGFRNFVHRAPHSSFSLVHLEKIACGRRDRRVVRVENADDGFRAYISVVSYV